MVLVMLGTQKNSFHRLLEEIEKCINNKVIDEDVIVQAGGTKYKSDKMRILSLVSSDELNEYIKQASYVITHGGVGSIVTCLKMGKKVIAVPRYHEFWEHVNDHQVQIVESFDAQGFVKGIQNVEDLCKAIKALDNFAPNEFVSNTGNVISIIENFIDDN